MNRKKLYDIAERTLWTFLQGGLAVISVDSFNLPLWAAPPIAAALASIKGFVAGKVNNKRSASTLPASLDPASPGA